MTVVQGESIPTKPPPIATAIIHMQMTPLVSTIGITKIFSRIRKVIYGEVLTKSSRQLFSHNTVKLARIERLSTEMYSDTESALGEYADRQLNLGTDEPPLNDYK